MNKDQVENMRKQSGESRGQVNDKLNPQIVLGLFEIISKKGTSFPISKLRVKH